MRDLFHNLPVSQGEATSELYGRALAAPGLSGISIHQGTGMKDYIYGSVQIEFWSWEGVVVRADRLSEPRGRVEGIIWVRADNGDEYPVDVSSLTFQVHPDDEVYILCGQNKVTGASTNVFLYNARNDFGHLLGGPEELYKALVETKRFNLELWSSVLLGFVAGWYIDGWGLLAAPALYVFLRIGKVVRKKRWSAGFARHVERMITQQYQRDVVLDALARNIE
ncbi:hypothetical protein C6Y56_11410 [Pseudomonas fluorescens]|uniref:Transmembrane protein n=2 Tax=Pseudomonas TaxID=286 RepID=A0A7Z3C439_PSEFL|nr:hypothetical protein C6Y56_11410 [Pseudomonas fluorescens]